MNDLHTPPSIAIVGAGAVGSLCAAKLALAGASVNFVDQRLAQPTTLTLDFVDPQAQTQRFEFTHRPSIAGADYLLVCVKAYQVAQATQGLALPEHCQAVLLVNGMGAEHSLPPNWSERPLWLGSNSHGALLENGSGVSIKQVRHTGIGKIIIGNAGAPDEPAHFAPLAEALGANWDGQIEAALWRKLAVNCCINPLTALYGIRNGALLAPRFEQQLEKLCEEFCQVADSCGVPLTSAQTLAQVKQVAEMTADNFSSMHQDLHKQRPTEIEHITGFLLKQAAQQGLTIASHQALYSAIKEREATYV